MKIPDLYHSIQRRTFPHVSIITIPFHSFFFFFFFFFLPKKRYPAQPWGKSPLCHRGIFGYQIPDTCFLLGQPESSSLPRSFGRRRGYNAARGCLTKARSSACVPPSSDQSAGVGRGNLETKPHSPRAFLCS